jgi:ribose transport system permease protein
MEKQGNLAQVRTAGYFKDFLMPTFSLLAVLIPIFILRPRVIQYQGLNLLLNMVIPVSLATIAQMFAMSIGEIDFSIENLVSLVTCIVGTLIPRHPWLGISMLAGILLIYATIGAFLYLKKLPSIIVTIGMSFVWTGLAVTIQPHPGGDVPIFIQKIMSWHAPLVPMPIWYLVILSIVAYVILYRTNFGILVRGLGGNQKSISQAGHSVFKLQIMVFTLVGIFGILSGIALAGITTSADANLAKNYTLLAVASVILGGGSFSGGKVSPVGAVLGACTMTLVGTLLTFLKISPDWQIGSQGGIILAVLFINSMLKRRGKVPYV